MAFRNYGIAADRRWFYPISGGMMRFFLAYFGIWSLFFPFLMEEFGVETIAPVAVGSSAAGVGAMVVGPPVSGTMVDKLGNPKIPLLLAAAGFGGGSLLLGLMLNTDTWSIARWYWYLGSFGIGFGAGTAQGTITPTVSRWFRGEKIGTAMGIVNTGNPLGRVGLAPFVTFLISYFGFGFDVFISMGLVGIVAIVGIGVVFWRNPTQTEINSGVLTARSGQSGRETRETSQDEEGHEDQIEFTIGEAARTKEFWILYVAMAGAAFSYMGFMQNISTIMVEGLGRVGPYEVDYVADRLVPLFLSLTGIFTAVGALAWGYIMDYLGGPWRTLLLIYSVPAVGIVVFYLGYSNLFLVLGVGSIMLFFFGGEPAVHFAAVPHLFGRKNIGMVMSYINSFSVGTGIVLGPTVMAHIADVTGGYLAALVLAVGLRLLSTSMALLGLRVS